MINNILEKSIKTIPLFIAILFSIYIIICYFVMDFYFPLFLVFLLIIILNILLYYVLIHPINYKNRGPSFIYVFIKVSYFIFIGGMIVMILMNVFCKKFQLDDKQKFHYIIVFGASVNIDDSKNYVINKRLEKAVEYAKSDNNIKFVLSGNKGKNDLIEEANYMKDYMISRGVKPDKILIDLLANNTYENINNSLYIIQQDVLRRNKYENFIKRPFNTKKDKFNLDLINIGFISSDFHMWRINLMAIKKGINKPYDILVKTKPFYYLYYYLRESLSMFKAFALKQVKLF